MSELVNNITILTGIFPPDTGGPATYVPKISEELSKNGHNVTVITLSDELSHDDSEYSFKVIRVKREIKKPLRFLKTVFLIVKQGKDANIIFANGLALEAVLANYFLRKPLFQKIVGDLAWERTRIMGLIGESFEEFQNKQYGIKIEFLKNLRSWWTRQADKIIVPSQYLAQWVKKWGVPEEKIHVIYNAVENLDGIKPKLIPLTTNIKIITVGRLVPWKNINGLIEAVSELDDVGLVIVGDGPERSKLETLTQRLGIRERVYLAGQRSKKETLSLMCACNIFVLNSSYEGLPHVILEAMALGLPVVATDVGGVSEVISDGENGFLINFSKSSAELVLQIKTLIKEKDIRVILARNGRLHALKSFSVSRMIQETEEILKSEYQSKIPP